MTLTLPARLAPVELDEIVAAARRPKRARAQQRFTDRAVEEAVLRLAPIIEEALGRVADRFLSTVLAAGKPIDKDDTKPIAGFWQEEAPLVAEALSHVYVGTTNVVMRQLGATRSVTEGLRDAYLGSATNRLSDVGQTLWNEAASTLADGNLAGEGYDALRQRLQDTFTAGGTELGDTRATRIARTEVQSAVNRGTLDGIRTMSAGARPQYKTWLASLDRSTREAHAEADGQTVLLDEQFEVDGELLDYPGDPAGSTGNVINCRCAFVVGDDPNGLDPDADRQIPFDYCGSKQDLSITDLAAAGDDGPGEAAVEEPEACAILDDPAMQEVGGGLSFAGDQEASAAWVTENYAPWIESVKGSEVAYLKQYTEDGFSDLNKALRAAEGIVDLDVHAAELNALDGMLSRTTVPEPITVFRQISDLKDSPFWGKLQAGDEFVDNAYVSTSLSNTNALGLGGPGGTSPAYTAADVRITVPKGSQGGPLAQLGNKRGDDLALALREDEFLLPRGSTFRVRSVGADGSLDLEVVR